MRAGPEDRRSSTSQAAAALLAGRRRVVARHGWRRNRRCCAHSYSVVHPATEGSVRATALTRWPATSARLRPVRPPIALGRAHSHVRSRYQMRWGALARRGAKERHVAAPAGGSRAWPTARGASPHVGPRTLPDKCGERFDCPRTPSRWGRSRCHGARGARSPGSLEGRRSPSVGSLVSQPMRRVGDLEAHGPHARPVWQVVVFLVVHRRPGADLGRKGWCGYG
jgi:hypothetical protein